MTTIDCHWNHNGSVLAVAGCTADKTNVVQFFSAYGEVNIHSSLSAFYHQCEFLTRNFMKSIQKRDNVVVTVK